MADQQAPPEGAAPDAAVDTPQPGTEEQPTTNWQERYEHLQPEFTRTTQELSQYRELLGALQSEDPDTRLQAAQILGLELAAEPNQPEDDEDLSFADEQARRELAELKAWKEQLTQGAQQQATEQRDVEHIGAGLAELQGKLGRDLTEQEQQILGDSAWANRDEQGLPNISVVAEAYLQVLNGTVLPAYKKTKPRAAAVAAGGVAGQQVPDRANETQSERWERMAQQLADLDTDT